MEVYNNTIDIADHYRPIHHQGATEFIVFNNNIDNDYIAVQHFRGTKEPDEGGCDSEWCDGSDRSPDFIDGRRSPTGTYYGYPCWHQPGRDANATLKPLYAWNNLYGSTQVTLDNGMAQENYAAYQLHANRDYYDAVSKNAQTSKTSPFNGTTGMGFGTAAFRPDTCTPTPEALDAGYGGVGYWATDAGGDWNKKSPNTSGNDGVLYQCTSTNTWTVAYTPYTYPHPLRGEGVDYAGSPSGATLNGVTGVMILR
jgi:hypothetical protein